MAQATVIQPTSAELAGKAIRPFYVNVPEEALAALRRRIADLPAGSTSVLIFPDNGDRYLDTIYSDQWVTGQFGEVTHLWKGDEC